MRTPASIVCNIIVIIAFYQITVSVRRISAKFKFNSTEMSTDGIDNKKVKGSSYIEAMNHANTTKNVDMNDMVAGDAQILAMANMNMDSSRL
jgi:hypothetical protein